MKTDAIEFDTQKSIDQITSAIRSFNCNVDRLESDPLSTGAKPAIAVLMWANRSLADTLKHPLWRQWGVQVIVTDLGNRRHIELVALGESALGAAMAQTQRYFTIAASRYYRDKVAAMLA